MKPTTTPAAMSRATPQALVLSGSWTALGMGRLTSELDALAALAGESWVIDASGIEALDTAGAWILQTLLRRLRDGAAGVELRQLRPEFARLFDALAQEATPGPAPIPSHPLSRLESLGQGTATLLAQGCALLAFIGECTFALGGWLAHPTRIRWRPILYNIRSAGVDALPIVGLLSFLLGIVVAYQGAAQLRLYGANIFVVDLVALSMLREFAPLITAIIVAGRSGSAYAAQIGTMAVTEEIDAMRTIGIAPLDMLVLPKALALLIALPCSPSSPISSASWGHADGAHPAGRRHGRIPRSLHQDGERHGSADRHRQGAGICRHHSDRWLFPGFQTKGGADSVGRQTTRSVVHSIFMVIVADALFSVAFSALDL